MIEKRTMWMVDYDAWLSKHRAKLKEQMPKVREFLEEMCNLCSSEDFSFGENTSGLQFKR